MKLSKKQIYWGLVAVLVIAGGLWYFYQSKQKPEEAPKPSLGSSGGGYSTTSSTSLASCGGLSALMNKFYNDAFFRNQWMQRGVRSCQVALAQTLLNQHASKNLVTDGIFGPKTDAAIQSVFGKSKITLNDIDAKYKITNIQPYTP